MKKYIKLLILVLTLSLFTSCDIDQDPIAFDPVNGVEGVSFAETSVQITVTEAGATVKLPVNVTTTSTAERTISVVEDNASTAVAGSFSFGSTITIPANSFSGTFEVLLNTAGLEDGILYDLIVNLVASPNGVAFSETATIRYNKEVICNDLVLVVLTDAFPEETTWNITDSNGLIVAHGGEDYGPPASVSSRLKEYIHNITLPDGCYTFTIFDAFGDGLSDGVVEGSWLLTCSILTHASGVGNFGSSSATEFCINQ